MQLRCQDMGMNSCLFISQGKSEEDVIKNYIAHVDKEHPRETQNMRKRWTEKQMREMMRAKIIE